MSEKHRKAASAAGRYKKESMQCNKPQRAPSGDPHKWVVKSCHDGKEKIVRYGRRGYQDYTQHHDKKRRANFRSRMGCDKPMDKNTPKYWACSRLW